MFCIFRNIRENTVVFRMLKQQPSKRVPRISFINGGGNAIFRRNRYCTNLTELDILGSFENFLVKHSRFLVLSNVILKSNY